MYLIFLQIICKLIILSKICKFLQVYKIIVTLLQQIKHSNLLNNLPFEPPSSFPPKKPNNNLILSYACSFQVSNHILLTLETDILRMIVTILT